AKMATAGTINGGSYNKGANDPGGVLGFYLKPRYTPNYVIDFEYQWNSAVSGDENEQLCMYITSHTGSETLNVKYYNGGSWASLGSITGTGWVNLTATGLTSSTYTIQLIGTTETDDTSQDSWSIDCMFLFTNWSIWLDTSNPDTTYPWSWNFNFPNGTGYYEFYSIGKKAGYSDETPPTFADARCRYNPPPIINSYDLRNDTGSKLNNIAGLLDVNKEYTFTVNITYKNSWAAIQYINITAWYDHGDDNSTYNQTLGGNLNMFLQYANTSGTAQFNMLWPKNEAQLVVSKCKETVINLTTRIINISFKPLSQVRWASSNNTWNETPNTFNDPYSWNFNITVTDSNDLKASKNDEYGVYKFSSIQPEQNWVDVIASPGFSGTSNVVTITYSSNYNYNISIYFEENLTHVSSGDTISIANNVYILANADPNDDITEDTLFMGVGEKYAVDIYNDSGIFNENGVSQTVNVQFEVYIPFGTLSGKYTARVNSNIKHD
ncbi:MAG: hypothetical protein QHH19_07080, partial [Candidatus Thermoplasmatota archaeon]|nr:hypothetical protein [Candidatus Thermoplasmatota archaeon]